MRIENWLLDWGYCDFDRSSFSEVIGIILEKMRDEKIKVSL